MNKGICIFGAIILIFSIIIVCYGHYTVKDLNTQKEVGITAWFDDWLRRYYNATGTDYVTKLPIDPKEGWDYYDARYYWRYGRIDVYPNASFGAVVTIIGVVVVVIGALSNKTSEVKIGQNLPNNKTTTHCVKNQHL